MNNSQVGDELLLTRLSKGDKLAFDQLYQQYSHPLYLNLLKLTKSEAIAEELLQEIFVRIWNKKDTLDIHTGLGNYLFKISQNLVYDFFRKAKQDKQLRSQIIAVAAEEYTHIEENLLSKENRTLLHRAISTLPPVRQQVFKLCKLEGKSYDEVAEELGIGVSTVNDHIVKATKHIKRYFPIILLIISTLNN
ncbi:RNA polymerase sigma-70 factor, ECF subfamily [Filimonas lacunae]|uniref:RNA polymerase sigma-70 factor, ECF subfamily n=1 Tax=Filimonas lacunae TaxID=477680 RepID=A0A173ML78_9BACT|nr:RNA polymerase sigma-70 factor [Filimonas lacunae]BAV08226.1 RNA polymerase ECF-type sigma factor [Filimonas lacunae]SIT33093.1 RNA polymerase sigma-70 factor, ECF subfamily [Filimonas lacunae]